MTEQFKTANCLNHFVLIAVCSAEFLVVCMRICTGFKEVSVRETYIYESTLVGETKLLSWRVSKS